MRKWESPILSKRSKAVPSSRSISFNHLPTSFVIRNALQWLKSPVGQPGDTALAAYVVSIHVS